MYGTRMLATILSTAAACTGTCLAQEQPSASKLTTLFTFAGLAPTGEMVHDATGAIYGAAVGGEDESGAVVEMAPPTARGGEWAESVIHSFGPLPDGSDPSSTGLVFDNSGRLYGTTFSGGNSAFGNLGTVFQLTPPAVAGTPWTETVIYNFAGGTDDANPMSQLVFGKNGSLYGTTFNGGGTVCQGEGCGTVFALEPPTAEGAGWTEKILYAFAESGYDGPGPYGTLLLGKNDVLYGITEGRETGGGGYVFQVTPPQEGVGEWTEAVLGEVYYSGFTSDHPVGLVLGKDGSLYGATTADGDMASGSLFVLTPPTSSGGAWTQTVLYSFGAAGDGSFPSALVLGTNGALYGTTAGGGANGFGTIYRMAPPIGAGGSWDESVLYSFTGGSDGANPADLITDGKGALYGSTNSVEGTVFQFVP